MLLPNRFTSANENKKFHFLFNKRYKSYIFFSKIQKIKIHSIQIEPKTKKSKNKISWFHFCLRKKAFRMQTV